MARLLLLTKKAFQNLRADLGLNLVTILVIALSLTLVGAFIVVVNNANRLVDHFAGQVEMMIFLKDSHTEKDLAILRNELDSDPMVDSMVFITKAQALERFKSQLAHLTEVAESMDQNPLPASFEVRLKPEMRQMATLDTFADKYTWAPGVEEVYYGKEWVERLNRWVRIIWLAGMGIGLFLSVTAVFIIAATLRLAIHRRKDEIAIMRLVGATNRFIQMPFILEGLFQGLVGAAISIGALFGVFKTLGHYYSGTAGAAMPFFPGFTPAFPPGHYLVALVLMGAIVGFFGSIVSIGKFLKV